MCNAMHYSKVNQTKDLDNELFILSVLGGRGSLSVSVSVCVSLCSVLLLGLLLLLCLRWKSSLIFITSSTDKSPSLLQGIPREENKNNLKIDLQEFNNNQNLSLFFLFLLSRNILNKI